MADLLDLGNNPILGWAALAIAVIGVVLAVYFYYKSRRFKRIAFVVTTESLIEDYSKALQDLQISYKGKEVRNLSVSKVAIWNEGTETFRKLDLPKVDPLRIDSDSEVVDAKVVFSTSTANQFEILRVGNSIQVSFDYLDKDQGGIVQLIHSGTSNGKIIVTGNIMGGQDIVRRSFGPKRRTLRILFFFSGFAIGGGFASVPFLLSNLPNLGLVAIAVSSFVLGLVLFASAFRQLTIPAEFASAREVV